MKADVLLDARATRRMSIGMTAYARQLAARLPRVAPDLRFEVFECGENFGLEEQVRLPLRALVSRARLVHFLSIYVPLVTPRPHIVTVHDLIHLRFPQYFKRSVGPYYATVVRWACRRAARVITDDDRTASDLVRFLGVDAASIRVIPLGIDDIYLGDAEPAPALRPYLLYAGNHREHKDLATLISAWRAVAAERDVDLCLTGDNDLGAASTEPAAHGAVRFLGHVDAAGLARLYRGAAAYVHPALCEGFGLPMLEAAAAGARIVACSDALPGVLASYADTFAPRDVPALAALLRGALDRPLPRERRSEIRSAARAYTWDRCAVATAEVYRDVLAELGSR
jgi:glycosyltransferase involved in cell wall biosynthesis